MNCPYCGQKAIWCQNKEVYGRNIGKSIMIWLCKPCDAFVGCHQNTTRPLGTMANKQLRTLRSECHRLFDLFWKDYPNRREARDMAYRWLQSKMKLHRCQAHIGKFNEEQCNQLLTILKNEIDSRV